MLSHRLTSYRRRLGTSAAIAATVVMALASAGLPTQARGGAGGRTLTVLPGAGVIDGSYGYQTVSAVLNSSDGSGLDVTASAALHSSNPAVIRIQDGVALPTGDGQADVIATYQ